MDVPLEMWPCLVYRLSLSALPKLSTRSLDYIIRHRGAICRLFREDVLPWEPLPLDEEPALWTGLRERLTRRE